MIYSILLQAGGGFGSLLPLLLVLVVMYFFFFRPQIKKQKQERNFQKEISKGMRVVTTAGIHGKIVGMDETTITLETENSRLKMERSAVNAQMSAQYNPKLVDKKDPPKKEKGPAKISK